MSKKEKTSAEANASAETTEANDKPLTKKQQKKADKKAKKAAKKAKKGKLSVGKKIALIILIIVLVAVVVYGVLCALTKKDQINYFYSTIANSISAIKDGSWQDEGSGDEEAAAAESTIDEFVPGTYGGIDFESIDDVVSYYVECYDATKAETANYIDADGNNATFYKMLGDESLEIVGNILIDGKSNPVIDSLVPGIMSGLFSANVYSLPPCSNRDPASDVDDNGDSLTTSRLVPEDIAGANVTDNGDGTITMVLQPVATEMSSKGLDSQGHLFNTLGAIDSTVESISVLSWASGTTAENCRVIYEDGTATVTIDTAEGKITEADYTMLCTVAVQHANVTVIKDKSATLQIGYYQHFPASDEYLMDAKGLTRA